MKKWLVVSAVIVLAMIIALVMVVQAFIPTPIPDPPTIADCPLAIHINEVDLSTTGIILISIDNLTQQPIIVDVSKLGEALNGHMHFYDAIGNEWVWADAAGATGQPFPEGDSYWQWNNQWNTSGSITIEPGRTENFSLIVNDSFALAARAWAARFRAVPDRLIYVVDCDLPTFEDPNGAPAVHVTAKGEAAFQPRP